MLILKILAEFAAMSAWWLLPLISHEGGLHSAERVARISTYIMWAFFGIAASWMFVNGWIKDIRRATATTEPQSTDQPKQKDPNHPAE